MHALSQPLISEMKGVNKLLIIDHPFMDSQLDFTDVLLADLELKTEVKDSNEGAEMFVIPLFRKVTPKDSGSDEQRPHGPC
jgi:hypothetical protein